MYGKFPAPHHKKRRDSLLKKKKKHVYLSQKIPMFFFDLSFINFLMIYDSSFDGLGMSKNDVFSSNCKLGDNDYTDILT